MSHEPPKQYKRRPHNKSRKGCSECRRRRIKCDELRPRCRSCDRRSVHCVYATKPDVASVSSTTSDAVYGSAATGEVSTCITDVMRQSKGSSSAFVFDDMPLIHHWTASTSQSISESPGFDGYWQKVFPEIGFHHKFVMHGILSVAALHLAYLNKAGDKRQRVLDATHHHNIALQGFREQISQLNADNSEALFACASLNVLYVFAISPYAHENLERSANLALRRSQILGAEWIPMIRGVEAVLHSVYERVHLGALSPIFDIGNWDEVDPDMNPAPADSSLRNVRNIWIGKDEEKIYNEALYLLRKAFAYAYQFDTSQVCPMSSKGCKRAWSGHLLWIHFAPKEYFVLLDQRQPLALVLFAYFGTLLQSCHEFWFMEGWGRHIVEAADELLGDYWVPWMEWPKKVTGLR